jgi:predicted acylesterase/phospholipase RssA
MTKDLDFVPIDSLTSGAAVTESPSDIVGDCDCSGSDFGLAKQVLYFAPDDDHLSDLLQLASGLLACRAEKHAAPPYVTYKKVHIRLVPVHDAHEALNLIHSEYFNLVILDLRDLQGNDELLEAYPQQVRVLLELMATEEDIETRYGFHRVVALVSGQDGDHVDRLMAELAARGIGRIIRDHSACRYSSACAAEPRRLAFAKLFLEESIRIMVERRIGRRALCASGGGITGIYFELGAMKALEDCLGPRAINSFDMYFGISAGAVVTSFLANGFSADECMAAIAGVEGGRIPPTSLSLFRLSHVNFRDLRRRFSVAIKQLSTNLAGVVRGTRSLSFDSFVLDYSDLVGPPFHAGHFETMIRKICFTKGATNDFRNLPYPLYIGATDQDLRTHVLFGEKGYDDVPISVAVQASLSINPAFTSRKIHGRYYEDGAVTRTSNFVEAIQKGADLLFILDPFVPYVSKEPGYVRRKGVLYNVDQDIRNISFTRFENMRNLILHHYPHVSSYTFLPANRLRRLLSVNPMDHRPYLQIWRGAYLSTVQRLLSLRYRLAGDLACHGVCLDTALGEAVADRLSLIENPVFADFFPDGKVSIKLPSLCRESCPSAHPPESVPTSPVPPVLRQASTAA